MAANGVFVSNISLTDNGKNYYGSYLNDDWKVTPKLTSIWVCAGTTSGWFEHHGNQANFIPGGAPTGGPAIPHPEGRTLEILSSGCPTCFTDLLAQDGIAFGHRQVRKELGEFAEEQFCAAPRICLPGHAQAGGCAAGFGIFYNGFENRGFSPNLGENYPFQFNFSFSIPMRATRLTMLQDAPRPDSYWRRDD